MPQDKMNEALENQLQLVRSIERSLDNFKKIGKNNYTSAKIRSRISALKEVWAHFRQGHAALRSMVPVADRKSIEYFNSNVYEVCEDIFLSTSDYMAECLEEVAPTVSQNQSKILENSIPGSSTSFSLAHLPPINLPPFSGKYEEWESFRDRFTALIIDNDELSNFARMHFLISCLKDRALECVQHLPVTADNFKVAWAALKSRFECTRRLINVHLMSLLNLPSVQRESALELQSMRDKTNAAIAALTNLKRQPADLWNDMLVCLVSQKLDSVTRKAWNFRFSDATTLPSFTSLSDFLDTRVRALEELRLSSASADKSKKPSTSLKVTSATASAKTPIKCSLCQANHFINSCPQFTKKNSSQRRDFVKTDGRCFNCLSKGHAIQNCPSKYTCRQCHKKHHTLLHDDSNSSVKLDETPPSNQTETAVETKAVAVSSLCASAQQDQRSCILLATAWVTVSAPSGRAVEVRALLDQGSEVTFVTERLAQALYLKRLRMPTSISAVGGVKVGTCRHAARVTISPRSASAPKFSTTALILNTLTAYSPKRLPAESVLDQLQDLSWADNDPMSSAPIDILLGADVYGDIILSGLRKTTVGRPIAQESIFGWVISGPVSCPELSSQTKSDEKSAGRICAQITSLHCSHDLSLDRELRQFWEVEEVPQHTAYGPEEERCEDHFRSTHSRLSDGRYVVRLPFRTSPPIAIGESYRIAETRLNALLRRLRTNADHEKEYSEFLQEYENLGHMQRVTNPRSPDTQCVFIPHHHVIRDHSSTTHLRVVFNASSATTNGSSLNDHLLAGPKLQTDLPAIILQWRLFKYVYTADITKMYRQILVDPRDTTYQRILWKTRDSDRPSEFKLLTVTYGTACAPFLALRVIKQLIADEGHNFPFAAKILQSQIYVDDVLFGDNDPELLRQIRNELREMLQRGGFELRKWASNANSLLTDISPENHGLACNKPLETDESLKVLGIGWNPASDVFNFKVSLPPEIPQSKRAILSTIARLFDPLGWVTPVTIKAKIFLQYLWQLKLDWDDNIPIEQSANWHAVYSQLAELNKLELPRWIDVDTTAARYELHGFADASSVAYAAVIYLKAIAKSGHSRISLIMGKSKVAPIKTLSIPRLELSAAVLLSRLLRYVQNSLKITANCYCWTDSSIVLAWLGQPPSKWKTFVANRVSEIQSSIPSSSWHHVPTQDNPADCASRGLCGRDLIKHELWWHGPPWLPLASDHWPVPSISIPSNAELEPKVTIHSVISIPDWDLKSRFSSWHTLIRVTAYVKRFISRCRRQPAAMTHGCHPRTALTADECNQAKTFWFQRIQTELFPQELTALKNQAQLPRKSALRSLNPFLDPAGLIRVGGRLKNAPLPLHTKHPILLASHPLVNLLVRSVHLCALHAGLQLTLATLRREFWILRARTVVKSVIFKCVTCTREKAASPSQLMGDLPAPRVTPSSRSFQHCGIDYAGPVSVRSSGGRGFKSKKAYLALFICLATKAIHLELVGDYSAAAFLDAFSRFCARRGLPQSMYSDNGTTFVGADNELQRAYRAAIQNADFHNAIASDQIEWHFLPPSAPHFGGLWEAGVKSVKYHIRRVLRDATLTFEEFSTLLCRVEACLNSRPLAPLTDNPDDYTTLTPGHFLIGSAITVHPEPSLLHLNENRLSRWQRVRHLTERFWHLWQSDYVNTLQQRVKWKTIQTPVRIGQLVLLRTATLPPCKWELGRIIRCHPGSDGLTRVVTVKTAKSEFTRPIVKLCILPVATGDDSV